ncbi:MAG: SDR family oxidoreductase [Anaerolineaceae bacterium]
MKKVLITGASGLLGINLALTAQTLGYEVAGVTLERGIHGTPFELQRMDLTKPGMIQELIRDNRPDVIINCVALTDVDRCECIPEEANQVNAILPQKLAGETSRMGIKLVQISTDAVFDGKRGNYTENDPPSPLNTYATTKLAGEGAVLQTDHQALVCRVNFYGWSISGHRSLAEWFYNKLSAGEPIKGFTDALFSPLLATDLAAIIIKLIEHDSCGILHVVNPQSITKYDFGVAIAKQFDFDLSLITPASIFDAGMLAARSPKLNLNPAKLLAELCEDLPDHDTEIFRFHRQYLDGYPEQLKGYSTMNV